MRHFQAVVSETMAEQVKTLFDLEPRGPIVAKHERAHEMFYLSRVKPSIGAILPSRPARGPCRRAQRRSRPGFGPPRQRRA